MFSPTLSCVASYFSTRRTLMMGCTAGGAALGATIFPILANHLFATQGFAAGVRARSFPPLFSSARRRIPDPSTACSRLHPPRLPSPCQHPHAPSFRSPASEATASSPAHLELPATARDVVRVGRIRFDHDRSAFSPSFLSFFFFRSRSCQADLSFGRLPQLFIPVRSPPCPTRFLSTPSLPNLSIVAFLVVEIRPHPLASFTHADLLHSSLRRVSPPRPRRHHIRSASAFSSPSQTALTLVFPRAALDPQRLSMRSTTHRRTPRRPRRQSHNSCTRYRSHRYHGFRFDGRYVDSGRDRLLCHLRRSIGSVRHDHGTVVDLAQCEREGVWVRLLLPFLLFNSTLIPPSPLQHPRRPWHDFRRLRESRGCTRRRCDPTKQTERGQLPRSVLVRRMLDADRVGTSGRGEVEDGEAEGDVAGVSRRRV